MLVFDQIGCEVNVPEFPKRIISLVPSQTELLYDFGLENRVVGITKFCIHPEEWFKSKCRVGGTKDVDIEKVMLLNPDLIIGNKEENTIEDIEKLREIAPVWISDVNNLEESLEMIGAIGEICNVPSQAIDISIQISNNFERFDSKIKGKSVLYLIWKNPYMTVAENTFIDSVLSEQLGLENVMNEKTRYPVIEIEDISVVPDYVFLSSEPYPFKEKHVKDMECVFPDSKVILVDGEYFSWYGSRLISSPHYFQKLMMSLTD